MATKTGTKMRTIEALLRRKKGVTAKEMRTALGWPSVSIPQRARQLGIKVRKETRYFAL
jgi:hypothetical protein